MKELWKEYHPAISTVLFFSIFIVVPAIEMGDTDHWGWYLFYASFLMFGSCVTAISLQTLIDMRIKAYARKEAP